MKRLLLIVLPLLLIVGCSSPEPINYETILIERDGVFYTKDTNKPYSGLVFSLYEGGGKKSEGIIKDGKRDGKWTLWYENGQKNVEVTLKDGKEDGIYTTWYENGLKESEYTFKDGIEVEGSTWSIDVVEKHSSGTKFIEEYREDGTENYTTWYYDESDGHLRQEYYYRDGKLDGLSYMFYPNGQKYWEGNFNKGEKMSERCWDKDGNECECSQYWWGGCK